MHTKHVLGGLSILVMFALLLSTAPVTQAVSTVPVVVNGGWAAGGWSDTFTFVLHGKGTLKAAMNGLQACQISSGLSIEIQNLGTPVRSFTAKNCFLETPADNSLGADHFYGNPSYYSFSLELEPGAYTVRWQKEIVSKIIGAEVTPFPEAAWVRVDEAPSRPPSIALTVVDPPATAWASVQWLDPRNGQWTKVDGWTGPLQQDEWGFMVFTVADEDRGAGVFRWVVYDKNPAQGGKPWAMTHTFSLPTSDWAWFEILKGWNLPK